MPDRTIRAAFFAALLALSGCKTLGPDFVTPDADVAPTWSESSDDALTASPNELVEWWRIFDDPVLDELVDTARLQNNNVQLAGVSVLESRAALGVATGLQYPQAQAASGGATYVAPPSDSPILSNGFQYNLGAALSWELDFWGRFKRGIESADAAFMASVAAYDQAQVILTAAVVDLYTVIRVIEEQLRIAEINVELQQRSYDITDVLFRNGADSELDVQQAKTLLLSTQATIPGLEISLVQARNGMSVLLGRPPGAVKEILAGGTGIPSVPENIALGVPADLLRRRPDVRQAELLAAAQSAQVGVAQADLYPSFSLTGSVGTSAGGLGDGDFGDLFDSGALTRSAGVSFVWPFLNYDRIKNNVRIQDARLQQALISYQETVLQAAREVEDAMATFIGSRKQLDILEETVVSATRSNELSVLRYSEGYSDYERVLDAQQALFSQQQRQITTQGDIVRSVVSLYRALGGGWENRDGLPYVDPETLRLMRERTDWGDMIE